MAEFLIASPFEMEGVCAGELKELGFENVKSENGRASFEGSLNDALRANMWLRTGDRVMLHMGSFKAYTFDELFEGVKALPWEDYITEKMAFPVGGKCARSKLMSLPDVQAITKKAIAERLKSVYGLEWLPETGAVAQIDVHMHQDTATLSIDTSGVGLAKRGYRTYNGEAPMRETMAASLLKLSPWYTDMPLCDPMCGTGTIAIEGALMALDRAPGMMRKFAMEQWPYVDISYSKGLREEAKERFEAAPPCQVFASDIDSKAVALTKKHVVQAGIGGKIKIQQCDFRKLGGIPDRGAFIVNLPYGIRIMAPKEVEKLYRDLGHWYEQYPYWALTAFTAHRGFEELFGRRADKKRRIYNGTIECGAYIYRGKRRERPKTDI